MCVCGLVRGWLSRVVVLYERLRRAGESALAEERAQVAGGIMWCASGVAAWLLYLEVPEKWLAVGWAVLALVLVEYGLRVSSRGLRVQGYLATAGALGWLAFVNFVSTATAGFRDARLWAGMGVVAACVVLHERLRRAGARVSTEEQTGVAGAAIWCASGVAAWVLYLWRSREVAGCGVGGFGAGAGGVWVAGAFVERAVAGIRVAGGVLCWLVMVNFTAAGKAGWGDVRLWAGVVVVEACVLVHQRLGRAGGIFLAEERTGIAGAVMWCASALVTGLLLSGASGEVAGGGVGRVCAVGGWVCAGAGSGRRFGVRRCCWRCWRLDVGLW